MPAFAVRPKNRVFSADCLGRVLNHLYVEMLGDPMNLLHLATQAEQVDRNDRANLAARFIREHSLRISSAIFAQVAFECRGRNVVGRGVDIDEYGRRTDAGDTASGGEKGIGGCNHGIAASEAHGHQDGQQRVRPGRNSDGMGRVAVIANRVFKLRHLRAENEMLVGEDLVDLAAERLSKFAILFA